MKKSLYILAAALAAVLCACNSQQSTREGASFEGLKTFYAQPPQKTTEVFGKIAEVADYNNIITAEIVKNLTAKGFINTADRESADIVFVPSWSVSLKGASQAEDAMLNAPNSQIIPRSNRTAKFYATLEVQAFLKNDPKWAWRGYSPIEASAQNTTTAMLKSQVAWAMEGFPPEKYEKKGTPILEIFQPSAITENEQKQRDAEIEAEKQLQQKQAEARAKEKLAKSAKPGQPVPQPTKEQIQAEYKTQSISELDKAFSESLEKK